MTDFCSENIYIDMTPRVGRREWDSNLEAVVGVYRFNILISFFCVALKLSNNQEVN
ncbi:MAG TPA: hypothetical protein VIY98_08825 [Nitrososphaeraceae archaeon]